MHSKCHFAYRYKHFTEPFRLVLNNIYTSFIHRTTAVEKINEQEIQLNKRTNNTKAHERIKR